MVDLLSLVIFKFDDFGVPSLGLQAFNNGEGVLPMSVGALVAAADRLEHTDSSPLLNLLSGHTRSHLSIILLITKVSKWIYPQHELTLSKSSREPIDRLKHDLVRLPEGKSRKSGSRSKNSEENRFVVYIPNKI